jgi:hypothetical protein
LVNSTFGSVNSGLGLVNSTFRSVRSGLGLVVVSSILCKLLYCVL